MWRTSSIIPVPKASNQRELNEFRLVALMSLVMKVLQKILKDEIVSLINGKLNHHYNLHISLGKVWMMLKCLS